MFLKNKINQFTICWWLRKCEKMGVFSLCNGLSYGLENHSNRARIPVALL